MLNCAVGLFAIVLLCVSALGQQIPDRTKIMETLDSQGCIDLEKTKACKYDYQFAGSNVEAISFRPLAEGRFPAVLLIPGFQRTSTDQMYLAIALAEEGFASVAITQPGFGRSTGKPDYVGPGTIAALIEGFRRFQREPFVNPKQMGVFGYSRGGMAASLLAVKLKEIKATVLGAGVYDFQKAYDEAKIEGIRANMKRESGMTPQAVAERSSILQMKNLHAPVLILHGEKDNNVPVSQALALRDTLKSLKKDFEIRLFPNAEHSIPRDELVPLVLDFLKRHLKSR
jgi:dipeptidyl aminopeptidase/acylaminoacyl peptidase